MLTRPVKCSPAFAVYVYALYPTPCLLDYILDILLQELMIFKKQLLFFSFSMKQVGYQQKQ